MDWEKIIAAAVGPTIQAAGGAFSGAAERDEKQQREDAVLASQAFDPDKERLKQEIETEAVRQQLLNKLTLEQQFGILKTGGGGGGGGGGGAAAIRVAQIRADADRQLAAMQSVANSRTAQQQGLDSHTKNLISLVQGLGRR